MVRQAPDDAHRPTLTVADADQQVTLENAADYLRGYCDGHEQGIAAGQAIEAVVRQLQATAWDEGYDAGHADGIAESRADVAQTITDLSAQYAEIGDAFARFGHVTREQRIAHEMAAMEQHAAKLHAQAGTAEWVGLDNGATLPSADWVPDTTALANQAEKARALAPRPVLTSWAQVRAYVDDRTWDRILLDLQPGPRGSQAVAIREANSTSRNGALA